MAHNANEFLLYIAKNERRLKRNLKKNITYSDEIFDDVYQNAIIKVYDSIVKNDKVIDDFEKYFFISSKFEYILIDNRRKKQRDKSDDISTAHYILDEEEYDEEKDAELISLVDEMRRYLSAKYGAYDARIFMEYYQMKSEKKCSYKQIAEEYNLSLKDCAAIIKKIKDDENFKNKFIKKYKSVVYG